MLIKEQGHRKLARMALQDLLGLKQNCFIRIGREVDADLARDPLCGSFERQKPVDPDLVTAAAPFLILIEFGGSLDHEDLILLQHLARLLEDLGKDDRLDRPGAILDGQDRHRLAASGLAFPNLRDHRHQGDRFLVLGAGERGDQMTAERLDLTFDPLEWVAAEVKSKRGLFSG